MKLILIPVTQLKQNCSLLICENSNQAAIVDPGGDLNLIEDKIKSYNIQLKKILITHGHLDHCGGAYELSQKYNIPIEGPHHADLFLLNNLVQQQLTYLSSCNETTYIFQPSRWLNDGDIVNIGNFTLKVMHCPGHTPGHIIFFEPQCQLALVGDVLFAGSIGRTDFPYGDYKTLINSITKKLWLLGKNVTFIPGHGPISTFGKERLSNYHVADNVIGTHNIYTK